MDEFEAGQVVRTNMQFTPADDSTVSIGNVSARVIRSNGDDDIVLSVSAGEDTNSFFADIEIPDNTPDCEWVVRWKASTPKLVHERRDSTFRVRASASATP